MSVTLIGYGEAGATFARVGGWRARVVDTAPARRRIARADGHDAGPAATMLAAAPVVLSLVTADAALAAARTYAPMLASGALWCDMNSVSPDTKRAAAELVTAHGGSYVDVAILAPVEPARLAVPLLLSGASANDAAAAFVDLGFTRLRSVGREVGRASAIKMIRSVMVKGIEALSDEMMRAADAAGVGDEVLASLDASERAWNWSARTAYNLERMDRHGLRRAAEMDEVALTLASLGVDPVMTRAAAARQAARGGGQEERAA